MKKGLILSITSITTIFVFINCSAEAENSEKKSAKALSHKHQVTWIGFNEGLEKAAKEKKNILVDFYTDWCHWCKVMDEKTFILDADALN